ncbi:MAG: hypothetical protein GF370_03925, partial [Candidatus Nealsonbacteria bacterium]|nr:hypothetical protein [Candidatus Nealsonbacteria bacterium]
MKRFEMMDKRDLSKAPATTGVYSLWNKEGLLYIGKAKNIKARIKNHFQQGSYRDNLFIRQVDRIGYIETESDIDALLLESEMIKRRQPKYNVMWRDDKNFFFVGITQEKLPRVFITHQTTHTKQDKKKENTKYIGPFVDGSALKRTLKTLRKIFPYYSAKNHPKKKCPWCHLGLCPGPDPDPKEYRKNIKALVSVLKGRRKSVSKDMKKRMKELSEKREYEKAALLRDKIESLDKIIAHARIIREFKIRRGWSKKEKRLKKLLGIKGDISHIEAYDVSNIQGKKATGSMVVFIEGEPDKSLYRKFKIKRERKPNDIAMLKEVLSRRFNHPEWKFPEIILIDGGKAQLNVA